MEKFLETTELALYKTFSAHGHTHGLRTRGRFPALLPTTRLCPTFPLPELDRSDGPPEELVLFVLGSPSHAANLKLPQGFVQGRSSSRTSFDLLRVPVDAGEVLLALLPRKPRPLEKFVDVNLARAVEVKDAEEITSTFHLLVGNLTRIKELADPNVPLLLRDMPIFVCVQEVEDLGDRLVVSVQVAQRLMFLRLVLISPGGSFALCLLCYVDIALKPGDEFLEVNLRCFEDGVLPDENSGSGSGVGVVGHRRE